VWLIKQAFLSTGAHKWKRGELLASMKKPGSKRIASRRFLDAGE